MSEALGKIEKPPVEEFKKGRKIYFVPLIFAGKEAPADFIQKFERYWEQVESQVDNLEAKLSKVVRIYHELIPVGGEEGLKALKDINEKSYLSIKKRVESGASLEAAEEKDLLTELMDWTRCLTSGLQNQKVFNQVYESYIEAGKKRNEYIGRHIDETLKEEETALVMLREGHQVRFTADIQVFYVAPPALDEIKRWLRDTETKQEESQETAEQG